MSQLDTMTEDVFVDPLLTCLRSPKWPHNKSCHLFVRPGTDLDALHRFAQSIGLKRSWFQPNVVPHYDLTESKRRQAVANGAVELERRAAAEVFRALRNRLNPHRFAHVGGREER